MKSETRQCQNCKKQFTIEPEDFQLLEPLDVPAPEKCPVCLWKHLLGFFVFGRFRKTKSALTGKNLITAISEKAPFPIYAREEWNSDEWDPMQFGKAYDFDRSFFGQFSDLRVQVPHPHQAGTNNVHCDWCEDVWSSKNCYLTRHLLEGEDLSYGYRVIRCRNSVDLAYAFDSELCYDSVYLFNCYKVKYAFDAANAIESTFLYDCNNVQNCFMCWNLRNKQYHILNQPYAKEAYFEKLKEFDLRSFPAVEALKQQFGNTIAREAIHRTDFNVNVINSTGNFLTNNKNCFECYFTEESENNRYMFRGWSCKDSIYISGSVTEKGALSSNDTYTYETVCTMHSTRCRYSAYIEACEECGYCFCCVGLRKKKYCILNKQYTEGEYHALVEKIKTAMKERGEWGTFFPLAMANVGYNFSTAQLFFPLTKEEAEKMGAWWEESGDTAGEGTSGNEVPDRIDGVDDGITTTQLICPATKRRFNIAAHELAFYREQGIPAPHEHFDYRLIKRLKPLTAITSVSGKCYFCKKEITHYYPSAWGYQKIACRECYNKEVA